MMQICLKCGYARKPFDGGPDWQCPGCGVAYCKAAKINQTYNRNANTRKTKRGKKPLVLLLLILLVLMSGYYWKSRPSKPQMMSLATANNTSGTAAALSKEPIQVMVDGKIPAFEKNGYLLTPLASFELQARVLSTENYWLGREADLSQTDLALGWGFMADEKILEKINISQSKRWFFWRVAQDFTPELGHEIITHASNMHIIPASAAVKQALSSIKVGQIVYIKGYLMEANASDGWKWRSSLSREDEGQGACELVWAEDLRAQ